MVNFFFVSRALRVGRGEEELIALSSFVATVLHSSQVYLC